MEKQEIIKTAVDIARQKGWEKTSLREISKQIGYSTIKIYSEFDGKDGLYQAIQEKGFKLLKDAYLKSIADIENPEEILIQLSKAHYHFAHDHEKYYELMFKMSGTNCDVKDKNIMFNASQPIRDAIFNICGKVDRTLFFNWWVIAHGFVVIVSNEQKISKTEAEEMLTAMIENFIKAIKL